MGWTYLHREPGVDNLEFWRGEMPETFVKHGQIVAFAATKEAHYIAYKPNDKQYTLCFVFGVNWVPRSQFNFGYKDTDEGMGPIWDKCPAKVLDALSPVGEIYSGSAAEWAQAWRDRCRANIATKKKKPKLAVGQIIQFAEPVKFTNGVEYSEMRIISVKPLRLGDPNYGPGYGLYRVSRECMEGATVRA